MSKCCQSALIMKLKIRRVKDFLYTFSSLNLVIANACVYDSMTCVSVSLSPTRYTLLPDDVDDSTTTTHFIHDYFGSNVLCVFIVYNYREYPCLLRGPTLSFMFFSRFTLMCFGAFGF